MSTSPTPSHTISHYRLVELLGRGGMGEVWLAEDAQLPRKVAVKLLAEHLCRDPEAVERLLREAQAAARVDHPGVVTIYEAGIEGGTPYLVMQRVEGPTLEERLHSGPLPVAEAVQLATRVADALAEVHALGIVHRDLKPGNIVLSSRGPKILDFGIASVTGAPHLTVTGAAPGTPFAMSPEQLRGAAPDNRADLWALGVILYQSLTGRRPFDGANFEAVAYQVVNHEPPAPSSLRPGVTHDLDYLVMKLLRKDPARRYARAEDLLADLSGCCLVDAPPEAAEASVPRLAVLPFEVMSPEGDDAFLAAGLVEDLIVDLARVEGLRVVPRAELAAYRERAVPPRTLARELDVDHVLTGSVRRAGNRARISAQLVRAADGHTLWAERFDRTLEDLFDVQAEVSSRIVEALQVRLKPEERHMLERAPTHDPEAYSMYLKARIRSDAGTLEGNREAEALLKRALELDPAFALAAAALAETYAQRAWQFRDHRESPELALEYAGRALSAEPRLVDALYARAMVYFVLQQPQKLMETLPELLALDPDRPQPLEWAGFSYLALGQPEAAMPIYERLMERYPDRYAAGTFLTTCYEQMKRPEDAARAARLAREHLLEYVRRHPDAGHARSLLAVQLARAGERKEAVRQVDLAARSSPDDSRVTYNRVCTLARAGETERALDALSEFLSETFRFPAHFWFERDPDLESLRAHPRFRQIVPKPVE